MHPAEHHPERVGAQCSDWLILLLGSAADPTDRPWKARVGSGNERVASPSGTLTSQSDPVLLCWGAVRSEVGGGGCLWTCPASSPRDGLGVAWRSWRSAVAAGVGQGGSCPRTPAEVQGPGERAPGVHSTPPSTRPQSFEKEGQFWGGAGCPTRARERTGDEVASPATRRRQTTAGSAPRWGRSGWHEPGVVTFGPFGGLDI